MKRLLLYAFLFLGYFSFSQDSSDSYSFEDVDSIINYALHNLDKKSEAITNLSNAIELAEIFNKEQGGELKVKAYNGLAVVYYNIKHFKDALDNFLIAEKYVDSTKDPLMAIKLSNNIALLLYENEQYDKAIDRLKMVYEDSKEFDENIHYLIALNLAEIYIKRHKFSKGYLLLEECKDFVTQNEQYQDKTILNHSYAKYYEFVNDFDKANFHYGLAGTIAKENGLFREAAEISYDHSNLLKNNGKLDEAYELLVKHVSFKEKDMDLDKMYEIESAKSRFEVEDYKRKLAISENEKLLESEKAKQSRIITIFVICVLILVLTLIAPLIYNFRTKNKLGKSLKFINEELRIAKAKAEQVAELKTKFISTVSHELRTPLYGVIGLTSILIDRNQNKKDGEFLNLLKFSADHLLNLINDVLQITKMESYEVKLHKSNFNVKTLVKNIQSSIMYQMSKNENKLHLEFDKGIPGMLIGDSVRLSQILINLISNANKFTDKGNIWMRLKNESSSDSEACIRFEIEDDGIGIPYEKQGSIFEKFSQVNVNNFESGTGLGLSIVKNLVELHEGKIQLESVPGSGSKFFFTIRFDLDFEQSLETIDDEFYIGDNSDYNILIVEDNKVNQIVTKNTLTKEGFKCEIASDGLIAVDMFKEKDYDLILMDLNMPNMDGFEATKTIREFNNHTPIIALTASETQETIQRVFNSGFNDFINKPYKTFEFFQRIKKNISYTLCEAS